jgi:AraC-like DNA-binding protein
MEERIMFKPPWSPVLEQVADGVGFANRHHFSRVFKQYAGCGPAQFRRGRSRP